MDLFGAKTEQRGEALFEMFYAAYPRKVAKEAARRAWKKQHITEAIWLQIQDALVWQVEQWTEITYVPYPATYLNGRRWEDPPPVNGTSLRLRMDRRQTFDRRQDVTETCPHHPKCLSRYECWKISELGWKNRDAK